MKLPAILTTAAFSLLALTNIATAAPKKLLVVTITAGFRHGPAIEAAEKVLPELAAKSGGELAFEFLSEPGPKPNAGPKPVRGRLMTEAQWADEEAKYKAAEEKNPSAVKPIPEVKAEQPTTNNKQQTNKPSFKEKFEFEQLEKEIPSLQKEKTTLEEKINGGGMDYDALQKAAERISTIVQLLDEKEMRWLELSERI